MADIYDEVAGCLQASIEKILGERDTDEPSEALKILRAVPTGAADYSSIGKEFTQAYGVRNYWKAVASIRRYIVGSVQTILDIGTGGGSSAIAAMAYVEDERRKRGLEKVVVQLVLVDRDPGQLKRSRTIVEHVLKNFPGLEVDMQSYCGDFLALDLNGSFDLVTCGYVATENPNQITSFFNKIQEVVSESSHIIYVERPEDSICDELYENAQARLWEVMSDIVGDHPKVTARCVYMRPGSSGVRNAVQAYIHAWERQSIEEVRQIFSSDATYHEKPFDEPIRGINGIVEYWKEHVCQQKNPRPRVCSILYSSAAAAFTWYTIVDLSQEKKEVSGMMKIEVNSEGKIRSLIECFRTRVIGELS